MNKIYKLLALLLLPTAVAAQPLSVTLEECRARALESSYNLKSAGEKIAASQDMLKAYQANNLPNFSLSGGYLYSSMSFSETIAGGYLPTYTPDLATGELKPNVVGVAPDGSPIFGSYAYMPDMNFDLKVGSVLSAGVQAAQPIYMGGKISTATKLARVGVRAAEVEHKRTEREVIVAADEAFYAYLKVEEMLRSADAYRDAVGEVYRQVESLLKRGMCTKNDLMKVQVKVNEAELLQLKARGGVSLARMNLCYVMGLPITTQQLAVVDNFDSAQSVEVSLDISERPEMALLAESVEAKRLGVRLAQSDFMPTVAAVASYSYLHGVKLNGDALFGSTPSFMGGVTVDVPIFHWGEGRRKVSAARREVTMAENMQADLEQKMTLELMQSINRYNEAQMEVALMERTVEQTAENLRQSGKHFEAGMETLSDYLEAQALWQKAQGDLVEARSDQRLAYMHYCRCRGAEM